MKNEKMILKLGDIDDKYIDEARAKKKKTPLLFKMALGAAACLLVTVTALNLVLFMPYSTTPPDVSRYSKNEYYDIIQKINAASFEKPKHKNNFEAILSSMQHLLRAETKNDSMNMDESMKGDAAAPSPEYVEVTDNQVAGVIEGDLIKRSDKYIYYLDSDVLKIYSINGDDSALTAEHKLKFEHGTYPFTEEMHIYLSEDCSTVTVVAPYYSKLREPNGTATSASKICMISLDVSDPSYIKEKNRVTVSGLLISSRSVDGRLMLMSVYDISSNPDFDDPSTFVPQITTEKGTEYIPADSIISPDTLSSTYYTVVYLFDQSALSLDDSCAFLSYSSEVYVSKDNIYATRQYTNKILDGEYKVNQSLTDISAVSYSDGSLTYLGSATVKGYVNDQYSLDEYEGILRVVTTTNENRYKERTEQRGEMFDLSMVTEISLGETNASLWCIDIGTWQTVAKVENFAPWGEEVRSVRFDKDNAYVCTSVLLKDPVFFFDLSDLDNITYKDTGTIEGFSSSLVNFGDGYVLGIGQGDSWNTVKIEIYRECKDGVESVCKYEFEGATYSANYKSFYIDRENSLVGLGLTFYSSANNSNRYTLLFFDGYKLRVVLDESLDGSNSAKRALYIDGYFYMLGENDFKVNALISEQ